MKKKKTQVIKQIYYVVFIKKTHNQIQQCSGQNFLFLCLSTNSKPSIIVKDNVDILTRSKCGNSRDAPTSSIKKTCSLYSNVLWKKSQWTPCLGPVYSRTEGDLVSPHTWYDTSQVTIETIKDRFSSSFHFEPAKWYVC